MPHVAARSARLRRPSAPNATGILLVTFLRRAARRVLAFDTPPHARHYPRTGRTSPRPLNVRRPFAQCRSSSVRCRVLSGLYPVIFLSGRALAVFCRFSPQMSCDARRRAASPEPPLTISHCRRVQWKDHPSKDVPRGEGGCRAGGVCQHFDALYRSRRTVSSATRSRCVPFGEAGSSRIHL
jgi:hypothetical protein